MPSWGEASHLFPQVNPPGRTQSVLFKILCEARAVDNFSRPLSSALAERTSYLMTFYIYKDARGEYRWRLRAANQQIIADSGEGYTWKSDCRKGIDLVKTYAAGASVVDNS